MTTATPVQLGPVGTYLTNLIAKIVGDEAQRPIVWFDPKGEYDQFLPGLDIDGLTVLRFEDTFFGLRHEADNYMQQSWPKLLLYVPMAADDTSNALLEFTAAGTTLAPGLPGERNTRLAVVTRRAFQSVMPEEELNKLVSDVEAGKLGLTEIENLSDLQPSVPGVIYKATQPPEIALAFATRPDMDAELVERKALGDVGQLLSLRYGLRTDQTSPTDLRRQLSTAALLSDLVASLSDKSRSAIRLTLPKITAEHSQRLHQLVIEWRNRMELRESYKAAAAQVEEEAGIRTLQFPSGALDEVQTFRTLEARLQAGVERRLVDSWSSQIATETLALVDRRLQVFWSAWPDLFPEVRPRWQLIRLALLTLQAADGVEEALKIAGQGPQQMLRAYTEGRDGEMPWCDLDTAHRRMEQAYHNFHSFDEQGDHAILANLLHRARGRYMEIAAKLAETFLHAWDTADLAALGRPQAQVFTQYVTPALGTGKTAYVLVDAMRFEIARESLSLMSSDRNPTLEYVIGTAPTITPVGMAALMPLAQDGVGLQLSGKTLSPSVAGTPLANREARMGFLQANVDKRVAIAKLEDLIPAPTKALAAKLRGAELVVVTSQEIDQLAEQDNLRQAHRHMDSMIQDVGQLIDKLVSLGCMTVIVTADHGYIFGEELDVGAKIDSPRAAEASLHRRVWIGHGGASSEYYMLTKLSKLGVESDLSIAVPWGMGAFKAPGARAYFHGGLSPQELVVPVLVLRPEAAAPAAAGAIEWKLTPSSSKLSSAFFAVTVAGTSSGLLGVESPRVRLEIRQKGNEASISRVMGASYGLDEASGAIQLKASADDQREVENNNVMVEVKSKPESDAVVVVLSDAVTGLVLKRSEEIPVAMQDWGGDKWL